MIKIIQRRIIWFIFSSLAVLLSIFAFIFWGLNLGIDFRGGSLLEISFSENRPTAVEVSQSLLNQGIVTGVQAQIIGEKGMILRFGTVSEETHQQILNHLKNSFDQNLVEERFDSIGPTIGQELKRKTLWAIGIVLVAIVLYIAWAFRKASKPVTSWKYGLIAVIALFHDIIIVVGVFCLLGKIYQMEVGAPFIAALLTILGYSVNDTIVIFDRTRENLAKHYYEEDFQEIVNQSVNQTIVRSINTAFTTLLVLSILFLLGGYSIKDFALALILGIIFGTYSSIFIASPLLVVWERLSKKES